MAEEQKIEFATNVFINCPFDRDYDALLKSLLFTVVVLGFSPRISSERSDAGEQRITKICELIGESQFSIHDLSRLKSKERNEFYRMNMPFELGIDYGSRTFHLSEKKFLVLETNRYEYMRALSDLSGVDIEAHQDDPRVLIRKVRNWLYSMAGAKNAEGPSAIWYDYTDFNADLYDQLKDTGFSDEDIRELPIPEYLEYVRRWTQAKME